MVSTDRLLTGKDSAAHAFTRLCLMGLMALALAAGPLAAEESVPPPKPPEDAEKPEPDQPKKPKDKPRNKPKPKTDKPEKKKEEPKEAEKPDHPQEVKYLLELAAVHRRFGHGDKALPLLNQALAGEPVDALKVRILQQAGETALADTARAGEAAGYFNKALTLSQDDEEQNVLRLWLGGAYRTGKQYAQAEAAFWAAYRGFKDDRRKQDAQRQCLDIIRSKERVDAALAEYEKRVAANPADLDALEILGILYNTGGTRDTAKALPIQEKLVAARPDDLDVLQELASLYEKNKQNEKAVELYRKIVEKKPGEIEKLARALARADKKDEASAAIATYLQDKADDPGTLERAAHIYEQIGENDKAIELRQKAVGLIENPQARAEAQHRLAERLRQLKKYPEAETVIRDILKDIRAAKPPADGDEKAVKAFEVEQRKNIARAKKSLIMIYEAQGKLDQLDF